MDRHISSFNDSATVNLQDSLIVIFSVAVDTTRVQIKEVDSDALGSDYINANYIRVSRFTHNACMSILMSSFFWVTGTVINILHVLYHSECCPH